VTRMRESVQPIDASSPRTPTPSLLIYLHVLETPPLFNINIHFAHPRLKSVSGNHDKDSHEVVMKPTILSVGGSVISHCSEPPADEVNFRLLIAF